MNGSSGDGTLRAANSALLVQNETLQRELESLKEQLLALRAELDGRAAGGAEHPVSAAAAASSGCQTNGSDTTRTAEPAQRHHPSAPPAQQPSPRASYSPPAQPGPSQPAPPRAPPRHGLSRAQAERYSRHLLLPAFGVAAQERLCRGSALVVGCGGLGSPVAMYLAASGVGRLGLVDHDAVDVTNLHRQVMHSTARVGMPKAVSGRLTCAAINPTVQVDAHTCGFSPSTSLALADAYDVVIDCSDNPATRYLVSDACVVAGKPLVSAAAVGTDGQLTVYNYGEDGPCYRCLFPESPAPENCSRCGEAGVLGVVPGIIGCLQALEAIKILSGVGDVSSKKMTIFDALAGRFTAVKLRGRRPCCVACGPDPAITRASLPSYDYVFFTGQPPDDGPPEELRLLDPRVRLAPADVARMIAADHAAGAETEAAAAAAAQDPGAAAPCSSSRAEDACGLLPAAGPRRRTVFLDVRPQAQFDVFALPGVVHVPYERLDERLPEVLAMCGCGGGDEPGPVGAGTAVGGGSVGAAGGPDRWAANGDTRCGAREGAITSGDGGAAACVSESDATSAESASGAAGAASGGGGGGPGSGSGGDGVDGAGARGRPRLVVLCRRGNNSQRVAARLAAIGVSGVTDMRGGYQAWVREVDPQAPML